MLANANTPAMRAALETLAGLASADQFGRHVEALQADFPRLRGALDLGDGLAAAQRRALGVTAATEAEIIANGINWQSERELREAALIVQRLGAKQCAERAARMLDWLGLEATDRHEYWQHWCDEFLTKEGKPRAASAFVSKAVTDAHPDLTCILSDRMRPHPGVARRLPRACASRRVSAALLTLAAPVLHAYAEHKEASGLLDYDDLIGRTSNLLVDPGAAWVLYKLDGGLDHLLLDEVQDTAPAQWQIAHALTAEFFAGEGRTRRRSHRVRRRRSQAVDLFVPGRRYRGIRSTRTGSSANGSKAAEKPWREAQLDVSFRSTRPVLELVDQVFANPTAAAGVVEHGQPLAHYADRADHAGAVELWPLAPLPEAAEPLPWTVPEQNQGLTSAPQHLAETLAQWIARQTGGGVMLESRGRPLRPGRRDGPGSAQE